MLDPGALRMGEDRAEVEFHLDQSFKTDTLHGIELNGQDQLDPNEN